MSKRNIHRSGWRLVCGALAVWCEANAHSLRRFLKWPGIAGAEAPESERATGQPGAAPVTGHLSEWREGDILMRDYVETLKRSAPHGMPSLARTRAIRAAAAMPALTGPGIWTFLGPDVITNGQANASDSSSCDPIRINVSGRVTALAFGKDPSTIYLGTALGGLWRSTDGANTWKPLLDQQASMAVGGLAVVPGTPDTIYVGTGEGNSSCDSEIGQGLLKSIDGGDTWEQKAAATFDRLTFTRLSVDPVDPKVNFMPRPTMALPTASHPRAFRSASPIGHRREFTNPLTPAKRGICAQDSAGLRPAEPQQTASRARPSTCSQIRREVSPVPLPGTIFDSGWGQLPGGIYAAGAGDADRVQPNELRRSQPV